ncbi:MAG: hypothetical protein A6F70_08555 [Cycloclasticus sp. symbiont of Bathymodiolus heckerae]|nr:MAG: hypothetical protein A6F70_08555 [Cycloclasticus sp. symbiont of Bathymodiolus heckerae]
MKLRFICSFDLGSHFASPKYHLFLQGFLLWLSEPVLCRVSSTAVVKTDGAEGTVGEALGWHFFGYFVATDKKATRPQGESL